MLSRKLSTQLPIFLAKGGQNRQIERKFHVLSICRTTTNVKQFLSEKKNLQWLSVRLQTKLDTNKYFSQKTGVNRRTSRPLKPYVDPKLSYAFGRSIDNLIYSTVAKEMNRTVQKTGGNQPSFISEYEGIEKTLKEFNDDINTVANSLLTRFNLKKGDAVGVFGYNSYNWVLVQFACARIGAVLVPINPSYKAEELAFVMKSAQVKCLFTNGPKSVQCELNPHLELLKSDLITTKISSGEIPLETVVLMDGNVQDYELELNSLVKSNNSNTKSSLFVHEKSKLYHWSDCFKDGRLYASIEEAREILGDNHESAKILDVDVVGPDDLFAIYYTSGTTGTPKGACISHFGALNNAAVCYRRLCHEKPDDWEPRQVTVLPFFHIFAGVLIAFSTAISQALMVIPSYKYDIEATANTILKHKLNVTALTPTIIADLLRYVGEKNLGDEMTLEVVQSGGAALPPEVVTRCFETLKKVKSLRIGYGSTENAATATTQSILEDPETRSFSVGTPVDFSEIRLVNYDNGEVIELGQRGEIETRGFNTMLGYLNDQSKTDSVINPKTRWLKTGDIGIMHPNGSLQIVGRLKSLIIRGGENIYPEEVERFIYKLPYVDTVHVIGIPDKRTGEEVCAWIKLKPGYCEAGSKSESSSSNDKEVSKKEVVKFCMENMTYFKVPKYILFVDSFPMTPTKKAQGHVMIEETIKILGLEGAK